MKNAGAKPTKTKGADPLSPFRVEPLPDGMRTGRPPVKHDEMLVFVRRANGEWCRVAARDCYSTANQQACRWRLAYGPQGYQFKLRRLTENGKVISVVYARFVGTEG